MTTSTPPPPSPPTSSSPSRLPSTNPNHPTSTPTTTSLTHTVQQLQHFDPSPPLLLLIGPPPSPTPLFPPLTPLLRIPFFHAALSPARFLESHTSQIRLPDDDPEVWKLGVEFLRSGEFFPRLVGRGDEKEGGDCDCGGRMEKCGCQGIGNVDWDSDADGDEERLEIPLFTISKSGKAAPFRSRSPRLGPWTTDEPTHLLFTRLVQLFCTAEKYAWLPLQQLCLRKLLLFPLGPRAFAVLLAHCALFEERRAGCEGEDPKAGVVRMVRDAVRYHGRAYEESKVGPLWGRPGEGGGAGVYADVDGFLEVNMGAEAWAGVRLLMEARAGRTREMRSWLDVGWWTCVEERQGVVQRVWDEERAVGVWVAWLKREGRTAPELKDGDEVAGFWPGCEFAEAMPGDLVTSIAVDQPAKGFVYGFVQRTERWGWFLRKDVRFLEQRSSKYCTGRCHELRTFKPGGVTLLLDDPEGRGIKCRTGRKSRGWRKTGGPKMLDRDHAMPLD